MCAAEALPIEGDMRILDLCAAPGGKTTQIAARMENRGLLVANEIIQKRAAILAENVGRMGLTNTVVTNESPERLSRRFGRGDVPQGAAGDRRVERGAYALMRGAAEEYFG